VHTLDTLGFDPYFAAQLELILEHSPGLAPARVVADGRDLLQLAGCAAGFGELSGRLRGELRPMQRPTTGDWVAVADGPDRAIIHHVLDRKTLLRRRAAGSDAAVQVVAANVDVFFVVTSADRDFSPRRLERYLTAVWDGGARPCIVLNKVDVITDVAPLLRAAEAVAPAVPVQAVSAQTGTGMDALQTHLSVGTTFGFVGSSGVGKSSLINRLLGQEIQTTKELRASGKGRHTTTRRELVVLPGEGILVDTPGMREFGMVADDGGLGTAFPEIVRFAEGCRYRDCRHESEPGCAVRAAVAAGELPAERLDSYVRLRRELDSADVRRDPVLGANTKRRWKSIHKQMRAFAKAERKRER